MVGKYVDLRESYKSLNEALCHGGVANNTKVHIQYVDSEQVEREGAEIIGKVDGILVPGGFGSRGVEGKIKAVQLAREQQIPYFGICFGMHMAVIEFAPQRAGLERGPLLGDRPQHPLPGHLPHARVVRPSAPSGWSAATSSPTRAAPCAWGPTPASSSRAPWLTKAYKTEEISERHRHRYEFNNEFKQALADKGLVVSGTSPDGELAEIVELNDHPWFLGCQFHPEFKSRPHEPPSPVPRVHPGGPAL